MARPIQTEVPLVLSMISERKLKITRTDLGLEPVTEFNVLPEAFKNAIRACPKTLSNDFSIFTTADDETFILCRDKAGYFLVKRFLGEVPVADAEPVLNGRHIDHCIAKLRKPWQVRRYMRASWRRHLLAAILCVLGFVAHGWSVPAAVVLWTVAGVLSLGYALFTWLSYLLIMRSLAKAVTALKQKAT